MDIYIYKYRNKDNDKTKKSFGTYKRLNPRWYIYIYIYIDILYRGLVARSSIGIIKICSFKKNTQRENWEKCASTPVLF